jgi:hypothetical protein
MMLSSTRMAASITVWADTRRMRPTMAKPKHIGGDVIILAVQGVSEEA